ncbi:hypothetical protein CPB84DRAFT_1688598 [Gymnopilus junonius]|uniref:Uncharacterized protein n=1 Tax=Gymnopilus junonius TaxID=109634 RepID=A0A9P5ND51_GYMJU|nr:hypothetical protein CPB84DRAFT_1688598 [Gymnopilus junonius]
MANLNCSTKSSSDWTLYDLDSYHITLNQVDALPFFGLMELPQPSVDQELLTNLNAGAMQGISMGSLSPTLILPRSQKRVNPLWWIFV